MSRGEIGKTAEGRPQLMAIITSPGELREARALQGNRAAARARRRSDGRSRRARWRRKARPSCGSTAACTPPKYSARTQLIETMYQLVSRNDPETMRILDDCIILAVHANPDGMELVSNWYMQDADTLKRSMNIPRLYQKYIGHDNNRDFYMSNQPETQQHQPAFMYREWFPQIVYNHHQTGPAGTVIFAPPFRDPFNYNFDPLRAGRASTRRRGDAHRFEAKASRCHGALGLELLDVVERRPAHDRLLPQHDRPAHGDDRQSDADGHPVRAVSSSCRAATCRIRSRRSAGTSASRSTTRSPRTAPCSTSRRATARRCCSTSTAWARTRSSAAARTPGR